MSAQPGQTLLVVEDNAIILEGLAVILRQEGYEVALAANGREALDYLGKSPAPALVLLDMVMPVLDGWHFLKEMRKASQTPIPVIVSTAVSSLTHEWAEQQGCTGLLHKPFEPDELLREVRRCLAE